MKRKLIELARTMLIIQMNHWLFSAAAVTILGMFGREKPHLFLWFILGIVPVYFYYVRIKVANFIPFFALHMIVPCIGWGLPVDRVVKFWMLIMLILYVVDSIRNRLTAKNGEVELIPPVFYIVIIGGITVLARFYVNAGWNRICFIIALIYIAGYFLYYFVTQYLTFVEMNEASAANIPEREIFVSGMKLVSGFSCVSVIVMILTSNLNWFSKLMSIIGDGIIEILKVLFSGLENQVVEEEKTVYQQNIPMHMEGFMYTEAWYKFLEFLEILYQVIAVCLMIGIVIGIVVSIYRFIVEHFGLSVKKNTRKILSNQDIREKCAVESSQKKRKNLFAFLDNKQKIRNLYRKRVLQGKKTIIGDVHQKELEYLTAKECCDKLEQDNLKAIYEKARYSSEEITSEDVRFAKR